MAVPDAPSSDARTSDTADGGWTVESHSKPMDSAPPDTTQVSESAVDTKPVADAAAETDQAEADAFLDTGTMPAPREATPAKVGASKKPKQTFQQRIDELTGQRRNAEREIAARDARNAELEARIKALETRVPPPVVEKPAAKPVAVIDDGPPDPPRYVDFETDEDYNTAVKAYRTQTAEWQTKREEKLRAEFTTTVDERLAAIDARRAAEARDAEVTGRLRAIKDKHPDFTELVAANAETFSQIKAPFLMDIITNTEKGAELLYDFAKDPDLALALGALPLPTRPLADAVRDSPAANEILKYFATDAGREDFERLRQMPPIAVLREIGKLEARLETAHQRGPASGVRRPITNAVPPAKPPVGSPRASVDAPAGANVPFDEWMALEDTREKAAKLQRMGVPA